MANNLPNPESREESYLAKAAGVSGAQIPEKPLSRKEQYLNAIANNGGGGGGGGDSNFTTLTDADANYTNSFGTRCIAVWKFDTGRYILDKNATVPIALSTSDVSGEGDYQPKGYTDADELPMIFVIKNVYDDYSSVSYSIYTSDNTKVNGYSDNLETGEGEFYTYPKSYDNFVGTFDGEDGESGLVPGPTGEDEGKFLKSDGTWATVVTTAQLNATIDAINSALNTNISHIN